MEKVDHTPNSITGLRRIKRQDLVEMESWGNEHSDLRLILVLGWMIMGKTGRK